jgi:phosphate-selective porin OprO/OprP
VLCCGLLSLTPAWATDPLYQDTLENILREKGIISKDDWIRIQAERERQEKELRDRMDEEFPLDIGYGRSGFELKTRDGSFATQLQWRIQSRWSYPDSEEFTTTSDFTDNPESTFELRRVRMKIGGHGYESWLNYYFEIDLQPTREAGAESEESAVRLLDGRITLDKFSYLSLRLGQWKVPYNRERRDSSGRLQFVERSIVNEFFTIDRQIGAMAYGRLAPGTVFDSHYYAGVYTGSGRGEANDDGNMMYFGRYQWNFLGRVLEFSQSDVEYHEVPAGNLAFAAYTTVGICTQWSSSGCGALPGFPSPSAAFDGQFRVEGMVEEFAFKWRGLSIQHEYHWKQIKNNGLPEGAPGHKTNLMGSYSQIGYFPHYLVPIIPRPLEAAFRYAFVDPDVSVSNDKLQEFTTAINWFFAGHQNKLTLDASYLTLAQPAGNEQTEQRIRLQWDVSF